MASQSDRRVHVGVDIGGTFTDLVAYSAGTAVQVGSQKVLTTEPTPENGILTGLQLLLDRLGCELGDVRTLVHGTTLAINSVVQRDGADTALITTAGFRDILTLGREYRYDIYDLDAAPPPPLIPRKSVATVSERTDQAGHVVDPPSPSELDDVLKWIDAGGYESVAVCFINSYANGANEEAVAERLESQFPGLPVSLSSQLSSQVREFERAMLATVNAFVAPKVGGYLSRLEARLRSDGFTGSWYVLGSNGGLLQPTVAADMPVRILESGPAGGAVAASKLAGSQANSVGLDMGGTTAKAFVLSPDEPYIANEFEVARIETDLPGSGYPISLPVVDVLEIGAGGGSIARVDATGLLTVGPDSAGAAPGPACYGNGGTEPTVTDANLVLGLLARTEFEDGTPLDQEAAARALESLATTLGLTVTEVAAGVHNVATHRMAEALRSHLVERGMAASEATLVAYGGAGPTHAGGIAEALGIRRVVFPELAGVLSAAGLLATQPRYDYVRSILSGLNEASLASVDKAFKEEAAKAADIVAQASTWGDEMSERRSLDLRYRGQGHEFGLPLDPEDSLVSPGAGDRVRSQFETQFEGHFGRKFSASDVEIVSIRGEVRSGSLSGAVGAIYGQGREAVAEQPGEQARLILPETSEKAEVWMLPSSSELFDQPQAGPGLAVFPHSTALVPRDWVIQRSVDGQVVMTR